MPRLKAPELCNLVIVPEIYASGDGTEFAGNKSENILSMSNALCNALVNVAEQLRNQLPDQMTQTNRMPNKLRVTLNVRHETKED